MISSLTPGGSDDFDFRQFFFGGLHHRSRVFTAQHHHHSRDDFAATITCDNALASERNQFHRADVANQNRQPAGTSFDHDVGDVFFVFQNRFAADKSLLAVVDDVTTPGGHVVAFQAQAVTSLQGQFVTRQFFRIDLDFKRLVVASHRVDFGDPRCSAQPR